MSKPGHLVGTTSEEFGATLTADVTIGDTVLHVDDTGDFDEQEGGFLLLGDSKLAYLPWDDPDDPDTDPDAGDNDGPLELTLAAGSPVAADEGDRVLVFDPSTGEDDAVTDLIALVTIDDRSPGSALKARIRAGLEDQLDSDFETYVGKAVELEIDQGELVLIGISGSKRTGRYRWFQDYATAPASGDVKIRLTYVPVPNSSVKVSGPGVGLNRDEWDFDPDDPWTIIVSRQGHFHASDVFEAHYAWTDPTQRPTNPGSVFFVGATVIGNTATSVDLPDGVESGDLLLVSANTGGIAGSNVTCSDARITEQHGSGTKTFLGLGYATASTDPIAISCSDEEHNGSIAVRAYRFAGAATSEYSTGTSPLAPTMPAGSPDAAAMLLFTVGSSSGSPGSPTTLDGWTRDDAPGGTNSASSTWSSTDGAPAVSVTPDYLAAWAAIVVGFTED